MSIGTIINSEYFLIDMSKKHLLSVVNINIEDFEKAKKGNEYMGDVFVIFKVVTK